MRKHSILLFLFLCSLHYLQANETRMVVGMSELSNLHINAFCQDATGYMWIATSRGLNKYNGYEYIHYFKEEGNEHSLPHDQVTSLFLDSRSRLWVGTNAGMVYYDSRKDLFTRCLIREDETPRCVYGFAEDSGGRIWVCMMDGIGVIDSVDEGGRRILDYKEMDPELGLFKKLEIASDGFLWIVMERGVLKYDTAGDTYRVVWESPDAVLQDMFAGEADSLYLATDKGLEVIDGSDGRLLALPPAITANSVLKTAGIAQITKSDHALLIAGDHGLFRFNLITKELTELSGQVSSPERKWQKITSCYPDSFGNLWIGTFNNGYTVLYRDRKKFNPDITLSQLLQDIFVTAVTAGKGGDNLWVGTRYNGLFSYNRKTGESLNYHLDNSLIFAKARNNFVQSLFVDSSNRLWVGLTDGACVLDVGKSGNPVSSFLNGLGGVVSIAEDDRHRIWIGTESSGLFIYSEPGAAPVHILPERSKNVTRILVLKSGKILVSFFSDNVYIVDPETLERFPLIEEGSDPSLQDVLSSCITMCETSPNSIWLGSYTSGMMNVNIGTGKYEIYRTADGLPSNDVLGIVPDDQSHLWLSTSFGLSRFDLKEKRFSNFFSFDGVNGNQFHEKACFKTPDQMIFMGGNYGLTFFNPAQIMLDTVHPKVVLERLKILNQTVAPSNGNILSENLIYTRSITLNHRQNVFTIDYSAIGFTGYQKYVYAYKLEGLDNDWNEVGSYRRATYMNLKPGVYTFKVRVRNESGVWSEPCAPLDICVKAAPYLTGWAYAFYLLLFAALVYLFIRLTVSIKVGKMSLEMVKNDQRREQQLIQMKINFFNNISHELQTPLSLIYGPLSLLLKNVRDHSDQHLLSIMEMNVNRLMKLISQLLDFGKMESDTIELKVREQDMVTLLQKIKRRFDYYAEQKHITFTFHTSAPCYIAFFDEDKIDKIMNNLLSNAFKYTPAEGKVGIEVRLATAEDVRSAYVATKVEESPYIEIAVSDEGPGIPHEELSELFERYKRLNVKDGQKELYKGTGLGLSYTKSLVHVHKGWIKAEAGEVKGMVFCFVLPLKKSIYAESEISREATAANDLLSFPPVAGVNNRAIDESREEEGEKKYTILVVDDDPGIQDFVKYLLQGKYCVLQAFNAAEGYHLLQEKAPDMVITDVLMPGMNGYEFCRKIKTNREFSHIAVVILTAKGRLDEHLEGLAVGADAYINKPFDDTYLLAIIRNLILNRERLKGIFHTGTVPEEDSLSSMDRKFMEQLYLHLDQHLDEVEMNVNNLSSDLGLSRSSFYRKMKALTGDSPNTFIRIYRLNKAKELLEKGEMTISEIAVFTGFSTLSYFSSCFKKQFGVSPTDYKNK